MMALTPQPQTTEKLYGDYKSSVEFTLTPAIPSPPICADETSCDWERVTLCAFDAVKNSTDEAYKFLDCMDSHDLPLFYEPDVPVSLSLRQPVHL